MQVKHVLGEIAPRITEGVILEIGAKCGNTTVVLANAKVPVYTIDMWDLTFLEKKDSRPKVHKDVSNFDAFTEAVKGLNVIHVKGLSAEIAKAWEKPIGLLFIDGDHSYEGCKADYEGFARHIIPGGYLIFHDYEDKSPGVQKLVDEIKDGWIGFTVEGRTAVMKKEGLDTDGSFYHLGNQRGEPCKRSIA